MSTFRGHEIYKGEDGEWFFSDTNERVDSAWAKRPCGYCLLPNTPEGHDGCLGTLPGVMNACCGHGELRGTYVQFPDGSSIYGLEAALWMSENNLTED